MTNSTVVEMSVQVLDKLLQYNKDADSAVSQVGGNSVQDGYRNNTRDILGKQKELIEIFIPKEDDQ